MATKGKAKTEEAPKAPETEELDTLEFEGVSVEDDDAFAEADDAEATPAPAPKKGKRVSGTIDVESLIGDAGSSKEYARILLYGKNKTGKSTTAAAPGSLFIKMEDGTLSVRGSGAKEFPAGNNRIQRWEEVEALYFYLKTLFDDGNSAKIDNAFGIPKGSSVKPTLVFDTLTRMRQLILRQVTLGSTEFDPTKDVMNPTQRDYGAAGQKMIYWLQAFGDLPLNIVWLAQERSGGDDAETAQYEVMPDLPTQVRNYVMSDADVIGRTYKKEIEKEGKKSPSYRVMFNGPEEYVLGDRTNTLPKAMANAKITDVINRMFGASK